MAETKTYDPARVIVTYRGVRLTGFFDGTHISAKRNEDSSMLHVGNDGAATFSMNRNRSGTVTINLTQSSPTNDLLSAWLAQDELTGLVTGGLVIKDLLGTTLCECSHAKIKKYADTDFANEAQARVWEFNCSELIMLVGGSSV